MMRLPRPPKPKKKKAPKAPERPTPERFENEQGVDREEIRKTVAPKRTRKAK